MTTTPETPEPIRLAFMCVQNAGRSQMATAFAERERNRRNLNDHVHEEVIDVMDDAGFDLSDRPREGLRSASFGRMTTPRL